MLLAELEVHHSRPAQPTRRLALGHLVLPVDPPPGLGGVLLGAVVAQHARTLTSDDINDVTRLIDHVEHGRRVVQPCLRHRYQVDRHGLAVSRHRLWSEDDEIKFDFDSNGTDLAQVLAAAYALERLDIAHRRVVAPVMRRAVRWRGPIGPALVAHLAGARSAEITALADPRGWALGVLGFPTGVASPSKREVTKRYRERMRSVHPDHGGDGSSASVAISELAEARRILTDLVSVN
jgi:hypothetical protein